MSAWPAGRVRSINPFETAQSRASSSRNLIKLGGIATGKLSKTAPAATIFAELGSGALKADQVADLALGARLRGYSFDLYKTKRKKDEEQEPKRIELNFACSNPASAEKAWARRAAIADGVVLARDLVNEPGNVLYPGEFARRTSALTKLGVGVEVLDVAAMRKLGMGALLGVGQGSAHEAKLVVMRWNGGKRGADGYGGHARRYALVSSHGNDDQHQDEGYDDLSGEDDSRGHPGGRVGGAEAGHGLGPLAVQAPDDGGGGDRPDELRDDVGQRVPPREAAVGG